MTSNTCPIAKIEKTHIPPQPKNLGMISDWDLNMCNEEVSQIVTGSHCLLSLSKPT